MFPPSSSTSPEVLLFPTSIHDNVSFGSVSLNGCAEMDDRVEAALWGVALWKEVISR
jgi:ABC-type phosphate transport system ATPase subunit